MPKLIVFRPDYNQIPAEKWEEASKLLPPVDGVINKRGMGDRVLETTRLSDAINPEYSDSPTHCRPSPWIILDNDQCYVADIPGIQAFVEVVVYRLGYAPLPESENPWQPLEIEHKTNLSKLTAD